MRLHLIVIFTLLIFSLTACAEQDAAEQRISYAIEMAETDAPVYIGFAWPFEANWDYLPEGVYLAVEDINNSGGVLNNRMIELIERDDQDSVREGRLIAQEFAEDPRVPAVIGHAWSYVSIPAAPLYEFNNLIMLSPSATSPELTRNNFDFIFRNVLSDTEVGRQLAIYAVNEGYRRIAILYVNESYGKQLSSVFENEATRLGSTILDRRSYRDEQSFTDILNNWETLNPDLIFIAGSNPAAAEFIRRARERDLTMPVLGSDGLDTADLWDVAGEAATGTIVSSFYSADNPDEQLQTFINRFEDTYGFMPDTWAAQGYDAMMLLAHAIDTAGSTVPSEIAVALKNTTDWQGVTGTHTFADNGDVIGKPLVLKVMQNGNFNFLELVSGITASD